MTNRHVAARNEAIKDPGVAASHCAFSGLEDGDDETGVGPGVVQSWGQIIKSFDGADVSAGAKAKVLQSFGPGVGCNPNTE